MTHLPNIKTFLLVPIFLAGLSSLAYSQGVAIEDGLASLYATQNPDGSWGGPENAINGVFPSTTTAVDALKLLETPPSNNQTSAIQYLVNGELNVTDYFSRRIVSLTATGNDTSPDINSLLALQNSDSGWGGAEGFGSNNLDTALALMALAAAGSSESGAIFGAISYLLSSQNTNGGWGLTMGDRSEIYFTVKIIQAFLTQAQTLELANAVAGGTSFLIDHQNADGGFGESGSTVWETSLSFLVLSMTSGDITAKLNAIDYLLNSQLTNGSWNDDPYSTALALQAIAGAEALEREIDNDSTIYPGAPDDTVDGIDQNCDGIDGPPSGDEDIDTDGFSVTQGDCDDNDATIYPGALDDTVDGVDQDCDGVDGVVAVSITAGDLFKEIAEVRFDTTQFGPYETLMIEASVNDPSAGLRVFVMDPNGGLSLTTENSGTYSFDTLNSAAGDYIVVVQATDTDSGVILDEVRVPFTIDLGVGITGGFLVVNPNFTIEGATENVSLAVSLLNASNAAATLTITHEMLGPSGSAIDAGTTSAAIDPGSPTLDLSLSTFVHTFIESGDYPISVKVFDGSNLLTSLSSVIAAAPEIHIEPSITLTPDSVIPDGDKRIGLEIHLEGVGDSAIPGDVVGPVDLTVWTPESYAAVAGFRAGVWTVAPNGLSVFQSANGQPTLFCSDFDAINTEIEGKIRVTGGRDDDHIGFALGFQPGDTSNPMADYLLVDWKRRQQTFNFGPPSNTPGSTAFRGLAASRVFGIPTADEFWGHVNFNHPSDIFFVISKPGRTSKVVEASVRVLSPTLT